MHCYSTFIVQERGKQRKKQGGKVGRKESERQRLRRRDEDDGADCNGLWESVSLHGWHVISGLPLGGLGWVKGTSSEEAPGKLTGAKRSPDFMGHLLPPLKALLNHNQITVNCQFLLDRKAPEPHSSQHGSLRTGTAVPQGGAGDSTLVLGSEGTNLGCSQPISHRDPQYLTFYSITLS